MLLRQTHSTRSTAHQWHSRGEQEEEEEEEEVLIQGNTLDCLPLLSATFCQANNENFSFHFLVDICMSAARHGVAIETTWPKESAHTHTHTCV